MRQLGERLTTRLLTLGWVAVGLGPVAAGLSLIRAGWAPVADLGLIAALTVDSLTLDPPLIGMPTSLGFEDGRPLSHAGPLGFWLLAVPTRAMGEPGHGLIVGALLLSLASIAAVAVLLRRRNDLLVEGLGLVLMAIMVAALGGAILVDPFNPYIGVLPLTVCLLATWGVLSGDHRQLWALVVAGSLTAQAHLGYVPLVAALVGIASVSVARDVLRSTPQVRYRLTRRIVPVSAALGVAAWAGPIVDQFVGTQNLERLWKSQSGDRPAAGLGHGLDLAVEMTSVPPRWLLGSAGDQDLSDPGALRVVLSLVAVAVVVAICVTALRRRDRPLAALSTTSLVALGVATMSSARVINLDTPYFDAETLLVYRLFWWPVGMVFTLTLVWGGLRTLPLVRPGTARAASSPERWPWAVVTLVTVAILISPFGYRRPPAGADELWSRDLDHASAIAELPGSPGTVVLRYWPEGTPPPVGNIPGYGYSTGLVAQLRLRGIAVRFANEGGEDGTYVLGYRAENRATGGEPVVLLYRVGPEAHLDPPPGYERLSVTGPGPDEPYDAFTAPSAVFIRA